MILENPSITVEYFEPLKVMRKIEKACRTCYRSEDKIGENTHEGLIKGCIARGHESVLEHEKITVVLRCDVGAYKDLTRHRHASFSIESTRYCDYSKDKFDGELHFIKPIYYTKLSDLKSEATSEEAKEQLKNIELTSLWESAMENIEKSYLEMKKLEAKPDDMRMILPHSTAATVTMTANLREWRHILQLRANSHAHPSVQQIMIPLLVTFKEMLNPIFGDIEYNNTFPLEKLAKLTLEGD